MNWGDLRKEGRNGLLLIMMALTWWGKASETDMEWLQAVNEVSAAVSCMIDSGAIVSTVSESFKANGKRPAGEEGGKRDRKRARR